MGSILRSLLLTICGVAMLLTAGALFDPSVLLARAQKAPESAAVSGARKEVLNSVVDLMSGSHQILAVHTRGDTPFAEVVLWLNDNVNPGTLDAQEVAVLTHSRLFQTITIYKFDTQNGSRTANAKLALEHQIVCDRAFCDRWRALPHVQPHVIATGISDMTVRPVQQAEKLSAIRLSLRWGADSTDGANEASTVINVGARPHDAQE